MKAKIFNYSFLNLKKRYNIFLFEKEEDVEQVIKNCEADLKIIFNV